MDRFSHARKSLWGHSNLKAGFYISCLSWSYMFLGLRAGRELNEEDGKEKGDGEESAS